METCSWIRSGTSVASWCEHNADPGQSTSLSPYCKMDSMYFDDSVYENEGHFRLKKLRDANPETADGISIDADSIEEYNEALNNLAKAAEGQFKFFGVSDKPHELVIEDDPRTKYKQFDEKYLEGGGDDDTGTEDAKE